MASMGSGMGSGIPLSGISESGMDDGSGISGGNLSPMHMQDLSPPNMGSSMHGMDRDAGPVSVWSEADGTIKNFQAGGAGGPGSGANVRVPITGFHIGSANDESPDGSQNQQQLPDISEQQQLASPRDYQQVIKKHISSRARPRTSSTSLISPDLVDESHHRDIGVSPVYGPSGTMSSRSESGVENDPDGDGSPKMAMNISEGKSPGEVDLDNINLSLNLQNLNNYNNSDSRTGSKTGATADPLGTPSSSSQADPLSSARSPRLPASPRLPGLGGGGEDREVAGTAVIESFRNES
jgi:hypothetical protein